MAEQEGKGGGTLPQVFISKDIIFIFILDKYFIGPNIILKGSLADK